MINKREDFKNSYYQGYNGFFNVTEEEFLKIYDKSKYGGYPEEPGGSIWESEGKSIYMLIRLLKPKRILEIGNFLGRSSNHILQAVEDNGFGDVVLLDIEERIEYDKIHSRNFERIINDSINYLSNPFEFDLILQDGDHTYGHVKDEIELILKNNKSEDYFIWAHDYYMRSRPSQCSVWKAWDEMMNRFPKVETFKDSISDCGFLIAKK